MAFINPLQLDDLLIGKFAGSYLIFIALALLLIFILGSRFRMSTGVLLSMIAIFSTIFFFSDETKGAFTPLFFLVGITLATIIGLVALRRTEG